MTVKTRQLVTKVTETGRATQLFTYDELGRLTSQGLDINSNGSPDAASLESITVFDLVFTNSNGAWEQLASLSRYQQDNVATKTLLQGSRTIVPAALSTNLVASNVVARVGGGVLISTHDRQCPQHSHTIDCRLKKWRCGMEFHRILTRLRVLQPIFGPVFWL